MCVQLSGSPPFSHDTFKGVGFSLLLRARVEPGTFIVRVQRLGLALFAALLWLCPGWWCFLGLGGCPSLDGRPLTCLIPWAGLGTAEELPFVCVSRPASPRANSRGQVPGCGHVLLKQTVLDLCILGSLIPIRTRNTAIALFSAIRYGTSACMLWNFSLFRDGFGSLLPVIFSFNFLLK